MAQVYKNANYIFETIMAFRRVRVNKETRLPEIFLRKCAINTFIVERVTRRAQEGVSMYPLVWCNIIVQVFLLGIPRSILVSPAGSHPKIESYPVVSSCGPI